MGIEAHLPTILTVVVTAAVDAINPCAIGVLILMLSVIISSGQSTKRMVFLGFIYVGSVMAVYLLAGLGLAYFFTRIPLVLTEYLSIGVALLIMVAAILEIKDFFWYGQGASLHIPVRFVKKIQSFAKNHSVWGVAFLGAFVSAVELPCTGAPYLAIITLLSQNFDFTGFLLLVLYNIVFVSPLIVILLLIASGKKIQEVKQWKQMNRPYMRLAVGVLLVFLAWMLILIANGTINLG